MGTGPRGLSVAPCCISAQPRAGGTSTTQRTASLEGSALCAAKYSLQIPSPAYKILRFPQTRCRILFIFAAQQAAAPRLGQSQLSPLLQAAPSERFSTDPVPSEGIWGLCPSSEGFVPMGGAPGEGLLQLPSLASLVFGPPSCPRCRQPPAFQFHRLELTARLEFRLQELLLLQASHPLPSLLAAPELPCANGTSLPGAPRNGATWNWL